MVDNVNETKLDVINPDLISFNMFEQYWSLLMCPVPSPLIVLELAWRPRLPERADIAGMKLDIKV